ncbi:MAG: 50S ribosomal protein L25/general stress protein Ctc [Candidatus Altimarinota bacterium]
MHSLEAKLRSETARETRENGLVPAVVYGKDVPSKSVSVSVGDFTRLFREVGQNHVFTLKVGKDSYPVLVHELQRHPVTGKALHVDFLTVDMKKEVHVKIPVRLVGNSQAVLGGGQLHQVLEAVDVKCLPSDVIDAFELDVAPLDHIGKALHVSDLVVDTKKFHILNNPEDAIALVHAVKEHKEETEVKSVADVGVATAKTENTEDGAAE